MAEVAASVTWSRAYFVLAATSDDAVTVAKETARGKGLRVVTVARVRRSPAGSGGWTVTLAVRGQEATEGV